jgi:beta-galactosidase
MREVTEDQQAGMPTARARRHTVPFHTGWLFGPASTDSTQPGFDDSGLETVTLPHSVTPLSWRNWDSRAWEQAWVYRKHFAAPDRAGGMRAFLDVEAAITSSTPVLNGQTLPGNVGGYLPFSVELTDYLSDRDNVLAVTLDSHFNFDVPPDRPVPSNPRSIDYWEPGGIYRDVKLRIVPQVFISDVFAKPVNVLTAAQREVQVQCTLDAAVVPGGSVAVAVELLDGIQTVSATSIPVTISQTGQVTVTGTLSGLAGVTLWDVDDPKLYTVRATLQADGMARHDYQVRIGFREANFTLDGFFLNGNRLKLFGLNRHQFFPFAGGAMSARAQRRDVEIMRRELNCNVVRCSHYPQSEDFYAACDELGLMVWEEIPGWGYFGDAAWQQAAYQDVQNMIIRDRNHPCVIVWGVMPNEAGAHVAEYTQYNELAHALDDSRQTGGDSSTTDASFVFDVFSNHDYGSLTGPDGLRSATLAPPVDAAGKPYLICETIGTLSGPALSYRRISPQQLQQGLATAHAAVHDVSFSDNRYCGVIAWAGFDYLSDATGNCFGGVKYVGVVDLFRSLKPGAAIYQSQVDPAVRPVIQPAFYWEFGPDYPVTILPMAMICANLDRLEVYVGGAHFAAVTPDTENYGHLPYPPSFADFSGVDGAALPELRIDGYTGGVQVASRTFSADTSRDRLAVTADDTELIADGSDETRVEFRAVDAYGNQRPYVRGDVRLSVTGPGVLIGDNPFAFGDAGGAGAVWIRTLPDSPGTITVQADHPALGSATAVIGVVAPADGDVAPVPSGALTAHASRVVIIPGSTVTLTASFANNGLPDLDLLSLVAVDGGCHVGHHLLPRPQRPVGPGELAGDGAGRRQPAGRRHHRAVELHLQSRSRRHQRQCPGTRAVFLAGRVVQHHRYQPGQQPGGRQLRRRRWQLLRHRARLGRPGPGRHGADAGRPGVHLAGHRARATGQRARLRADGARRRQARRYQARPAGRVQRRKLLRDGRGPLRRRLVRHRAGVSQQLDQRTERRRPGPGLHHGRHLVLPQHRQREAGRHDLRLRGHGPGRPGQDGHRGDAAEPLRYPQHHGERGAHLRGDHRDPGAVPVAGGGVQQHRHQFGRRRDRRGFRRRGQ